ncbi:MAG: hypothetical protein ACXAD7_01085 [Candidatus Kariarchaeaceae archaeon]|jgi:hypothetical protein
MVEDKVRITFSCDRSLQTRLTKQAHQEGIPRSQLIVELLDTAFDTESGGGTERAPAANRLLFDMQKRVGELESWRRQIHDWTTASSEDTSNIEQTLAGLLNEQLSEDVDVGKTTKKNRIPSPKR